MTKWRQRRRSVPGAVGNGDGHERHEVDNREHSSDGIQPRHAAGARPLRLDLNQILAVACILLGELSRALTATGPGTPATVPQRTQHSQHHSCEQPHRLVGSQLDAGSERGVLAAVFQISGDQRLCTATTHAAAAKRPSTAGRLTHKRTPSPSTSSMTTGALATSFVLCVHTWQLPDEQRAHRVSDSNHENLDCPDDLTQHLRLQHFADTRASESAVECTQALASDSHAHKSVIIQG